MSASKSHVIYKPLVVVNQKPLLLARGRCWRKLWEKVLPALPRGHAQFKPGTDCLSSQHCIVNTFFSFLLKLQRVWGLLLYFLTGFFILWSGQKRKCLNKSDVYIHCGQECTSTWIFLFACPTFSMVFVQSADSFFPFLHLLLKRVNQTV